MLRYASVGLFVERAQAAHAEVELSSENAGRIAEICRRLDGLPLAIDLAARVRLLPPRALLSRLSQRFSVLTGGRVICRAAANTQERTRLEFRFEVARPVVRALLSRAINS